jgi:chorismate synthase
MSSFWGKTLKLSMFGEVQGQIVGGTLHDFPKGVTVNTDRIKLGLKLRQGIINFNDAFKAEDTPKIISGITAGVTNGAPITVQFDNKHLDDRHFSKYFSPRFTLPMVFFGMLAQDYLANKGIHICSHIKSVGETYDDPLPPVYDKILFDRLNFSPLATINCEARKRIVSLVESLKATGDSVGCKIETVVTGLPRDLKSPLFDNLDARIAKTVFPIPLVNGVTFDKVINESIVMTTSCRPTPTVAEQLARQYQTIELDVKHGHKPCAVPRTTIVVTSAVALSVLDALLEKYCDKCD